MMRPAGIIASAVSRGAADIVRRVIRKAGAVMKKPILNYLSILLVLTFLVLPLAGASTVYAGGGGTPYIIKQSHDMYVTPGSDVEVFIEFSEHALPVVLEYQKPDGSWKLYKPCNCPQEDGIRWEITVEKAHFPDDNDVYLRFRFDWDGGYAYSEPFSIYWDDYKGYYRIAGYDRYDTAILIAEEKMFHSGLGGYPNVIVACGTDFADALGGSYLSVYLNAPIFLVNKSPDVIARVADNIAEYLISGGGVYILGGTGAVPASFDEAVKARGISEDDIIRFAGKNRYDTNLKILGFCGVYSQDLIVCCGTNFADALSASPLGRPILLVGKTLTPDQEDFLMGIDPAFAYITGGTGAVTPAVESGIKKYGYDVKRLAGANRYETSRLVAEEFFLDYQHIDFALAYAKNFPDGLAGGALAYDKDSPLLLVDDLRYQDAKKFVQEDDARCATIYGGETLISDETVLKILGI